MLNIHNICIAHDRKLVWNIPQIVEGVVLRREYRAGASGDRARSLYLGRCCSGRSRTLETLIDKNHCALSELHGAQMVKNLPAMWETQVQSLGREDPLKCMASCFSILAWRIPWTEEPGALQFMGSQKLDMTEQLTLSHSVSSRVPACWGLNVPPTKIHTLKP